MKPAGILVAGVFLPLFLSACGGGGQEGGVAAPQAGLGFPKIVREVLLTANPEKWYHLALVRESSVTGEALAYRWEFTEGDRDRRGQGAFVRNVECFLNAYPDSVTVIEESRGRLEIVFSFEGRGQKSTLQVVAEGTNSAATVTFDGEGALYDEFMERIAALEDEYVNVTPEDPGDSLNWSYPIPEPGRAAAD